MSGTIPLPNSRKTRSKNGCLTCRIRKVKCDERRPVCQRCATGPMKCEWLEPGRSWSTRNTPRRVTSRSSQSHRRLAPSTPTLEAGLSLADDESASSGSKTPNDCVLELKMEMNNQGSPRPTLSAGHIPLSNSLQLTADDQAAFLYIPDSILVLSYGKLWKWSCFSYIYTNIASQYSGVMRSFIAVAAMELRAREILDGQDGHDPARSVERAQHIGAAATAYYSSALKDLSSLLHHICHSEGRSNDIDALFTMWFLILKFEAYDSDSTGASMVHLDGIRSFLKPYMQSGGKRLPYVAQTMLLYTLFLDADSATGNIDGGRLCMDLSARDANDFVSHEYLFRSARSALPKIWGDIYPVAELIDDLENYRPLRLFHLCQGAKLEFLRLARSTTDGSEQRDSLQSLWRRIQNFGDEFADILVLAKLVPDSGGKRLMWTVYSAALDFHALQALYLCLHPGDESQSQLESSLVQIFAIASKALGEDPRQIYRFMWSLSVALCQTQGHTDTHWLSAQLDRARVLLPNFGVPGLILQSKK